MSSTMNSNKFIHYFCYGSNLLSKRMLINNKSAEKFCNGLLNDYRLTFSGNSKLWKGSTANIVKDPNSNVYGVVYRLSMNDIENLDRQEIGYDPIEVLIKLYETNNNSDDKMIKCRTYVQKSSYSCDNYNNESIPSRLYKDVIVKGAQMNCLPANYIENVLKKFPDNGIIDCGPEGFSKEFYSEMK